MLRNENRKWEKYCYWWEMWPLNWFYIETLYPSSFSQRSMGRSRFFPNRSDIPLIKLGQSLGYTICVKLCKSLIFITLILFSLYYNVLKPKSFKNDSNINITILRWVLKKLFEASGLIFCYSVFQLQTDVSSSASDWPIFSHRLFYWLRASVWKPF